VKTKYVLITPAHNEEQVIELAIRSVISQSVLPEEWIIVDDTSTDGTGEIIRKYQAQYNFITYHQYERQELSRGYARRAHVFLSGYKRVKASSYSFIGGLDADISMEPTYYECILHEFDKNPRLGIASGVFVDKIGNRLQKVPLGANHVPGAIQLFRYECYEAIGGYIPQKYGGDDTCAEIMARMKGWQTRSFPQYKVIHYRPVGTSSGKSIPAARFYQGLAEYAVATHPLFMLAKSLHRLFVEKPRFIAAIARLAGFLYGYWLREERTIPADAIRFVRREQIRRLVSLSNKGMGYIVWL
jgi:biofilm PGA synthesis N-glycosyltransferase PgaC